MAIRNIPADDTDDDTTALPEMVREAIASSRALGYVLCALLFFAAFLGTMGAMWLLWGELR